MKLYELLNLFNEDTQMVEIFNIDENETIYKGEICDCDYKIEEMEVGGIDTIYEPTDTIVINVYSE